MSKLTKIDNDILWHMQRDGRLTNAKLANELAMSESPCWRRLKRLERKDISKVTKPI